MSLKKYRWLIVKTAKVVTQRFSTSAKAIPSQAWQTWANTLTIGLGIYALIMFFVTHWAMNAEGLQTWDEQTLKVVVQNFPMSFDKGVT